MFAKYVEAGGPVMIVVLALWVLVLAGVLDRLLYALVRAWRRPRRSVQDLLRSGDVLAAQTRVESERLRAARGLGRIDAVSQIAPSVGLFGTVLGLAQSFFARGDELGLAAPEVLASGLATALFTTLGGLLVFLLGQGFLIVWREWEAHCERGLETLLVPEREA